MWRSQCMAFVSPRRLFSLQRQNYAFPLATAIDETLKTVKETPWNENFPDYVETKLKSREKKVIRH